MYGIAHHLEMFMLHDAGKRCFPIAYAVATAIAAASAQG